jgi:hypothetical protein
MHLSLFLNNYQISYTKTNEQKKEMKSQEEILELIKRRTMEKIVFTRNLEPFKVSVEELPPFIPDIMRAEVVVNSEAQKNSALLASPTIVGMIKFALY